MVNTEWCILLVSTTDNRKTISNFHPTKCRSVQNTMGQSKRKSTKGEGWRWEWDWKRRDQFFFIYNIKNDGGFDRYTILRNVRRLRARAFLNFGALVPSAKTTPTNAVAAATIKKTGFLNSTTAEPIFKRESNKWQLKLNKRISRNRRPLGSKPTQSSNQTLM